MYHHVTESLSGLFPGAAGVFTYYMLDKDLTLAVMFLHKHLTNADLGFGWYNVKVYPQSVMADQDLYDKMRNDKPYQANGQWHPMPNLGSGFTGRGKMSIADTPTLEIVIEMPPSKRTTE